MTDFLDEMDQLAAEIAKEARLAATGLDDKVNAFKALTPYWVQKTKKGRGDDESDGDFDSLRASINAAGGMKSARNGHDEEHGHG